MDVKSIFLNGIIKEVYIEQKKGFIELDQRNVICKLNKTLYGLKQTPRAWYERLHFYLIKIGFARTSENNDLYLKYESDDKMLIAKIFVDDIIFGGRDFLCNIISNSR